MPCGLPERDPDVEAARRCLRAAGSLPPAWQKLLIAVACRIAPEDVIAENGSAYGSHGRLLFTLIKERLAPPP